MCECVLGGVFSLDGNMKMQFTNDENLKFPLCLSMT